MLVVFVLLVAAVKASVPPQCTQSACASDRVDLDSPVSLLQTQTLQASISSSQPQKAADARGGESGEPFVSVNGAETNLFVSVGHKTLATKGIVTAPFVSENGNVELPGEPYTNNVGDANDCYSATPNVECGQIEFRLHCTSATRVSFTAEVLAPDDRSDSFHISLDTGTPQRWNTGDFAAFRWSMPSPFLFTKTGEQSVFVQGREDGIKIHWLKLEDGSDSCSFLEELIPSPAQAQPAAYLVVIGRSAARDETGGSLWETNRDVNECLDATETKFITTSTSAWQSTLDDVKTLGTSCCSNEGVGSRPDCKRGQTFLQAKFHCEGQGLVLCTAAQLTADVTAGTGCGFDSTMIWASDQCDKEAEDAQEGAQ